MEVLVTFNDSGARKTYSSRRANAWSQKLLLKSNHHERWALAGDAGAEQKLERLMAFFAKNNLRLYLTFQLSLRSVHMLKIVLVFWGVFFFLHFSNQEKNWLPKL